MKKWQGDPDEADEEDDLESGRSATTSKPPVYWRARDSLYFEPLVALMLVVLLIVGMYAYTQNWPPIYVVESDSMQHGSDYTFGVINTGDLVLAQKISTGSIVPYVVGMQTGYSTYGEYGDVLLYEPDGVSTTPVIHRAILYLTWNPTNGTYNATDLNGLPCGTEPGAVYATPGTANDCVTVGLNNTLDLFGIGWSSVNVSLPLSAAVLGSHSGFLTMGDNNFAPNPCDAPSCIGYTDPQQGISQLVEPGWIVGVARGLIPWVGSLKLALEGKASEVPPQAWQFLGLTVAGIILLAVGIHFVFRAEGIKDPRRKAEEDDEEEERQDAKEAADEEDEETPRRHRPLLETLTPWRRMDERMEEEGPPRRATESSTAGRRGRPKPHVRRPPKKPPPSHRGDDEDEL